MLDVISNALKSPTAKVIQDGYYQNEQGVWGYYITVWDAGHYHMISVSHTEQPLSPHDIAKALTAPEARIESDGRYQNKRGTLGYYATVLSGEHWYMVSVSDMLQPFHRQWWFDRWQF
ncbi:MAG TPA: hypothetical protein VLC51_09370 [Nitrospira sp.]|nr:hypothetical protein [Nitrospira sp.]